MSVSSKEDVLYYLNKNKELLYKRFGVNRIGIFGSFVKQCQTDSSDIDIVIEMEKTKKTYIVF